MAHGINTIIASGSHRQLYGPYGWQAPSVAVLNPNDGVVYLATNRDIPNVNNEGSWDYKLPSQSYGLFPGPWMSVGIFYLDQSGSGRNGEITVYQFPKSTFAPDIRAIGRSQVQYGTAVDISQGTQPSNPPSGSARLWIDANGNLHILESDGSDAQAIDNNDVMHADLEGSLLPNPVIANGAVTSAKIADRTIVAGDIALGTISSTEIATPGIVQANLAKPSVGSAELVDGSVTSGKVAQPAIITAHIYDGNITLAKMAANSVGNAQITTADPITGNKIGANQITDTNLATASVTTPKIANGAVTQATIAQGATTKLLYELAETTDLIVNGTTAGGGLAIPNQPKLLSLNAGVTWLLVEIDACILSNAYAANWSTGWDFYVQNVQYRRLSRQMVFSNQVQYIHWSGSLMVHPNAWGGGSGGRQFGVTLYASTNGVNQLYLRCATQPNTEYLRMTVYEMYN